MRILTMAISILVICMNTRAEEASFTDLMERGGTYLSAWQVGEASEVADLALELSESEADKASAYFLKAQVEFYKGDYPRALEFARLASSRAGNSKEIGGFVEYLSGVSETAETFKELKAEHFAIRYSHPKDSILLGYAQDILEKAYFEVGLDLEAYPGEPVIVEIYPDLESFTLASTLSEKDIKTTGVVGICKFNRIMILSPRLLPQGYSWFDTLTHEYAHYLIFVKSGNTVPVWLHEGIAKLEEKRWKEKRRKVLNPFYETLLAAAVKEDNLVPIEKMHPSLGKLENAHQAQLAFAQVGTMIEFLIKMWGSDSLVELLDEMKEKKDYNLAIKEVTKISFDDFYVLWQEDLGQRKLEARIPNLKIKELEFKQQEIKSEDPSQDLVNLDNNEAKGYTRLGDLLKTRGRLAAASYEYEKALHFDPTSPIIINRLASTQIARGEYDQAEGRLSASLHLYPEYVDSHINLGKLYLAKGNLSEAEKSYQESISINPFDPQIHLALASIYTRLGLSESEKSERRILGTLIEEGANVEPAAGADASE